MNRFPTLATLAAVLMVARLAGAAGDDEKEKPKGDKAPTREIRVEVQQLDRAVKVGPVGRIEVRGKGEVTVHDEGDATPDAPVRTRVRVVEVRPDGKPVEFELNIDDSNDAAKSGVVRALEEILKRDDLKLSEEAKKAIRTAQEAARKAEATRVRKIGPALVLPPLRAGMPEEARQALEKAMRLRAEDARKQLESATEAQRRALEEAKRSLAEFQARGVPEPPAGPAIEAKLDRILERLEQIEKEIKELKSSAGK
jgi:hypothetical protein